MNTVNSATIVATAASALAIASGCVGANSAGTTLRDATGAEVVVAPELGGRVMSFRPAGMPEGFNALWLNPLDDIAHSGWMNHGGEKTWIGPQSSWPGLSEDGKAWPPPLFFDQAAFKVDGASRTRTSIEMSVPAPANSPCLFGISRRVALDGGVLRVEERAVFGDASKADGCPYHVWSVAQVPHARLVGVRTVAPFRVQNASAKLPEPTKADGGLLLYDLENFTSNGKAFFDADLIALEYPEGTLAVRRVAQEGEAAEGPFNVPHESRGQLYSGSVPNHPEERYIEVEFTADAAHALVLEFTFHLGKTVTEVM